jgi:hypothetical protein
MRLNSGAATHNRDSKQDIVGKGVQPMAVSPALAHHECAADPRPNAPLQPRPGWSGEAAEAGTSAGSDGWAAHARDIEETSFLYERGFFAIR